MHAEPATPSAVKQEDAVQEVVSAVCHDLGAGTRQLVAFTHLLAEHLGGDLDEEAGSLLDHISSSAAKFDRRLSALNRFSRAVSHPLELTVVDPSALFDRAMTERLADTPAERPACRVGPLPSVTADPEMLVWAFGELIDNSLKFAGQPVQMSVWAEETDDRHVLVVEDDGPGFQDHEAAVAFGLYKRFHDSSIPGTGTGLAIVKQIIGRHGGDVEIRPVSGADGSTVPGAAIRISLPR